MTKKKKIILATVASSILLTIGVSLTYIFAVALPQKQENEQLLKEMQEYYDAKLAMYTEEMRNMMTMRWTLHSLATALPTDTILKNTFRNILFLIAELLVKRPLVLKNVLRYRFMI